MSGIEKLQFEHAQILRIFGLGVKEMFLRKIYQRCQSLMNFWTGDMYM